MDVTPLIGEGQQIVQSYAGGQFRISSVNYEGAIFLWPDKVIDWNGAPEKFSSFMIDHFQPLIDIANEIDVLLLGTGDKMEYVSPQLRQALSHNKLPVDVMDTGAACRTYNVLMAEGRRVVCALMPTSVNQ